MQKTLPLVWMLLGLLIASTGDPTAAQGQDMPTTIFLIRHAEKVRDSSFDPHLTLAGTARAEKLAYMLSHVRLTAVYSTPFHRCRETAQPTARRQVKKIRLYQSNEEGFLDRILKDHKGGNVLVVGHSNTVPMMVNVLTGTEDYPWLPDAVYDNMFIVTVIEKGKAKVTRLRFGAHTPLKKE